MFLTFVALRSIWPFGRAALVVVAVILGTFYGFVSWMLLMDTLYKRAPTPEYERRKEPRA
jgi:hypothetical protein